MKEQVQQLETKITELEKELDSKILELKQKNRQEEIEAALERVRTKTMAMRNSQDVGNTVAVMFEELMKLEVSTNMRSGVIIIHDPKRMEVWTASAAPNGTINLLKGYVDMIIHSLLQGAYKAWKNKEATYKYELVGEDLKNYYRALIASPEYPFHLDIDSLPQKQVCSVFFFPEGALFAFTPDHLSPEATQIFTRFTSVFALTYRRYQDLQKAEAQAKEAVRQASLDRVRAEIASMRTTNDLERITPLIWKELTILKVPFIRCGVFIIDEKEGHINVYLSTPDGKAIAAFQLPLQSEGLNPNVLNYWKNNQTLIDYWDEAAFLRWTKRLVEHGALQSNEKYVTEKAPSNLYLHFLPFLQGMLYVGNTAPLSEDEIKLVQSLANAFSTAYARYEDFNKLEAAKQQLENTLKELRSAQQQLIQSEKMASLGELTAGIAHEIQNPLNFVNNFSEVNRDLIEELESERTRMNGERDEQMEDEILNDISLNLLKILEHGKRADAIVKGMLQHSRANAGQKEPANINALADEFLRLSYHGLRAKDKSFNAIMETHFDSSIGKINMVPQDMGRVLLNLFNNAFYAVTEKKKQIGAGFEPKVTVTTKRINDCIEIVVKDNGNGIPASAIDKIFQPFFTTKPTGRGTGLGLSLSYDIVTKEHGGELTVKSKEGEYAEFTIQLPVTTSI